MTPGPSAEEPTRPPRPRTPPYWWVLFGVGLIVAAVGAIVWLGATNGPGGRALVENPGGIIAVLVGGVLSVTAVIIPKLNSIRDATAATQHHVVNDHGDRVLRDDLDKAIRLIEGVSQQVTQVIRTQNEHGNDIGGMRAEVRQLRDVDRDNGRDIAEVRGNVADLDRKLDEHLEWSREYVQTQHKEKP